jgi:hypothetical protein
MEVPFSYLLILPFSSNLSRKDTILLRMYSPDRTIKTTMPMRGNATNRGSQITAHHNTIKKLTKSSLDFANHTAIGDKQRPIEK